MKFCTPEEIEIKGEEIYVADTGNHRIQVFETPEFPPATCPLPGDNPPCGEVVLKEVIDHINQWSQGQAPLTEVIDLINAWAGG